MLGRIRFPCRPIASLTRAKRGLKHLGGIGGYCEGDIASLTRAKRGLKLTAATTFRRVRHRFAHPSEARIETTSPEVARIRQANRFAHPSEARIETRRVIVL